MAVSLHKIRTQIRTSNTNISVFHRHENQSVHQLLANGQRFNSVNASSNDESTVLKYGVHQEAGPHLLLSATPHLEVKGWLREAGEDRLSADKVPAPRDELTFLHATVARRNTRESAASRSEYTERNPADLPGHGYAEIRRLTNETTFRSRFKASTAVWFSWVYVRALVIARALLAWDGTGRPPRGNDVSGDIGREAQRLEPTGP